MQKSLTDMINDSYDVAMFYSSATTRLYGTLEIDKIGFHNLGYWCGIQDSVELAQINLLETLAAFFTRTEGNVLDVGCGIGASSKLLSKIFSPKDILGINISEKQLNICRAIAPESRFQLMDAAKLELPDGSFDNILCVDCAHHFMTRDAFIKEAYRVLTPGGRIAIYDMVAHNLEFLDSILPGGGWPEENRLPDLDAYKESLTSAGFRYVRIEDVTEQTISAWVKFRLRKEEKDLDRSQNYVVLNNLLTLEKRMSTNRGCSWCMVFAVK
jgi:MPBQ/MSBQ methyltransferase